LRPSAQGGSEHRAGNDSRPAKWARIWGIDDIDNLKSLTLLAESWRRTSNISNSPVLIPSLAIMLAPFAPLPRAGLHPVILLTEKFSTANEYFIIRTIATSDKFGTS
jgi:hypothetical protein